MCLIQYSVKTEASPGYSFCFHGILQLSHKSNIFRKYYIQEVLHLKQNHYIATTVSKKL